MGFGTNKLHFELKDAVILVVNVLNYKLWFYWL